MKRIMIITAALLLAACSPKTPKVGVACAQYEGIDYVPASYTGAITKAGGQPVILPTIRTEKEARQLMAGLDGIVFPGGEDVSPAWYGEEVLNSTVEVNASRDRSDSLLARAAIRSGKPILAICRGSQLMNVMLGGSLYQDIPSQVPQTIGHSGTTHTICLESDGFLAKLYGCDSLTVNSTHHQAVKDPALGVKIVARASDGIVEAWETPRITAVQFHPEALLAAGDTTWLTLFKYWVQKL